jgi:Holliday junction resolvase-like predicted endonuclease
VDWKKQQKLRQLARLFQERFPSTKPCRFDVAAVLWPPQGEPQLRYIPDAFY